MTQAIAGKEKEVNITHETLFEILRREKNREELQKLDDSFFSDLISYLQEKQDILRRQEDKSDIFSFDEKKKVEKQLDSVMRILTQLYERRERKIINMALMQSRTHSSVGSSGTLLKEEHLLFSDLLSTLKSYRSGILQKIMASSLPAISESSYEKQSQDCSPKLAVGGGQTSAAAPNIPVSGTKMVRFTHPIPKFVGSELEVFGPFEEEDVASLPAKIADLLIEKGRAEEIRMEPDAHVSDDN